MTAPLFQFGQSHPDSMPTAPPADVAEVKRCTVPAFAKAIGHEDKWKLHNNCKSSKNAIIFNVLTESNRRLEADFL